MSTSYSTSDIQNMLQAAAAQYGLPPSLLLGIAQQESNFNPLAVSPINHNGTQDFGVMQINSVNFGAFGLDPTSALDPQANINAGAQLLSQLWNQFNGNVQQVIWAYNAGPGAVNSGNLPSSTALYIQAVMANINNWDTSLGTPPTDTSGDGGVGSEDGFSGTINIFGQDVPTDIVLVGGVGLVTLLWLWMRG